MCSPPRTLRKSYKGSIQRDIHGDFCALTEAILAHSCWLVCLVAPGQLRNWSHCDKAMSFFPGVWGTLRSRPGLCQGPRQQPGYRSGLVCVTTFQLWDPCENAYTSERTGAPWAAQLRARGNRMLSCREQGSRKIFFFFGHFRAAPSAAYGGSQARGLIGAVAARLHHSHSNTGSEPCLQPIPQFTATPDP